MDEAMATRQPCRRWRPLVNEIDLTLLSGEMPVAIRRPIRTRPSRRCCSSMPRGVSDRPMSGRGTGKMPSWTTPSRTCKTGHQAQAAHLKAYALFWTKQFERVLALPSPGQEDATLAFSHQMLRIWAWQGMRPSTRPSRP